MSEIRAATISNLAGTGPVELTGQVASKSWVNFDGTGTVSIRESFNVSSITDNGTGDYTVNFSTAMVDANYAAVAMGQRSVDNGAIFSSYSSNYTANSNNVRLTFKGDSTGLQDSLYTSVVIVR